MLNEAYTIITLSNIRLMENGLGRHEEILADIKELEKRYKIVLSHSRGKFIKSIFLVAVYILF